MSKKCTFKKGSTYYSSIGNIKIQVCTITKNVGLTISKKGCYTEKEPLKIGLSDTGRRHLTALLVKADAFLNK